MARLPLLVRFPGRSRGNQGCLLTLLALSLAYGLLAQAGGQNEGEEGELLRLAPGESPVTAVAFLPGGKQLVTGARDGMLGIWNIETGQMVRRMRGAASEVTSLACSPDGRLLAAADKEGGVHLVESESGKRRHSLLGHRDPTLSLCFLADGRTLASAAGGVDKTLRTWNTASGQETARVALRISSNIYSAAISPEGRWVLTGHATEVRLWDAATARSVALKGHTAQVTCAAFSRDSRVAATGSKDKTVRLWDLSSRSEIRTLEGHRGPVTAVAVSPDGKRVLSGGEDLTVRLWDWRTGQSLAVFKGHQGRIHDVAFAPHGLAAASASEDGTVRVWSLPR
jgi:WD40 repeat protein